MVCVLGEGSAQYAITGLWSAVAYEVPVTFLVLRNEEYAILKWFADVEEVKGAPGSTCRPSNTAEIAAGYGVASKRVGAPRGAARGAGRARSGRSKPELIEVPVAPGMHLF